MFFQIFQQKSQWNLNMSKIIAIAGLKNSGKTEAAKMMEYLLNTPSFLHNYFCFKHLPKIYNR